MSTKKTTSGCKSLAAAHLIAALFFCANVFAEKADRAKPLDFEADRLYNIEEKTSANSRILEGNVVIEQGTMRIKANRIILREDKNGARFGEGTGSPVFFRQKHDERNEFFEAYGERIEFDERTNLVKLFSNGKLKLGQDELVAEYITYNTVTEKYDVVGAAPGTKLTDPATAGKAGRVKGTLYPTTKGNAEKSTTPPADTAEPKK